MKAVKFSKRGDEVLIGCKQRLRWPGEKRAEKPNPRKVASIPLGLYPDDKLNLVVEATKIRPRTVELVRCRVVFHTRYEN